MIVLITGVAGFIGFHLASKLIDDGVFVIGIDNLNDYYDVNLKEARLTELRNLAKIKKKQFLFYKVDLENYQEIIKIFENYSPTHVVNLAAQAGVRYSIENPSAYIQSNLVGFSNILEACRKEKIKHLVFASSSSVYGGNDNFPFSEKQGVDHPVSLYAATKRSNELIAHTYSHLYSIPSTGLRFFTVYGPWGRPDMALFSFTKKIIQGYPIEVFNNGEMFRSFTYIDDIVEALSRILIKPPSENKSFNINSANPSISWAPFRIFNIGNSESKSLMEYIKELEVCLGLDAKKVFLEMQPGDVPKTAAETSLLEEYISYKPKTNIKEGIKNFVNWYKMFYGI
jgi:UDP-glucuronate 4-epimerase